MFVAQNFGGGRPDRIRRGVLQGTRMSIGASLLLGIVFITLGTPLVRLFVGDQSDAVGAMAAEMLVINGACYSALGVLFVLRGALQGLGHTMIPTVTEVVELIMRGGAAVVLGAAFGYVGVVWSNPLAWLGAAIILVPAYVRAHRDLAHQPIAPALVTPTTSIPVVGPSDGSMVVDAIVTQPITLPMTAERRNLIRVLARRSPSRRR